jgi:hypothetical protein
MMGKSIILEAVEANTVAQRFREIQQLLKVKSVAAFANEIGLDASVLNNIMSPMGRQGNPSFETLQKIALKFPRVNMEWLVTGRGEPLRPFGAEQLKFNPSFANIKPCPKAFVSAFVGKNNIPVSIKKKQILNQLKVCIAEKENLEKIIVIKDEMIAILRKDQSV